MKRMVTVDFTASISVDIEVDVGDNADLTMLEEEDLSPEEQEKARLIAANLGVDPDDLEIDAIWIPRNPPNAR